MSFEKRYGAKTSVARVENYRVCARDVIKFSNPKLKSH